MAVSLPIMVWSYGVTFRVLIYGRSVERQEFLACSPLDVFDRRFTVRFWHLDPKPETWLSVLTHCPMSRSARHESARRLLWVPVRHIYMVCVEGKRKHKDRRRAAYDI